MPCQDLIQVILLDCVSVYGGEGR